MTYPFGTETRQYNSRVQLTRITVPSQMDLEYRYSATQNNGQITQMKNWISGEEVNYTYDSLSRLSSAVTTGPEWGLSFTYDGFGNRLNQTPTKGSAPTNTVAVDAANHVIGHTYDARGNTLAMPGLNGLTYDASNRLTSVTGVGDQYSYAPDNRRVYKNGQIFFYGADGNLLGVYTIQVTTSIAFTAVQTYQYFGGREISRLEDRLKSVMTGSRYYPYGEESPATANDKEKFTGYRRDNSTTLDYAHNRYYASTFGRFLSTDPLDASGEIHAPSSWNRYPYTANDPANARDPSGLVKTGDGDCSYDEEFGWYCIPYPPPPAPPPPDRPGEGGGGGPGTPCAGQAAILWRTLTDTQRKLIGDSERFLALNPSQSASFLNITTLIDLNHINVSGLQVNFSLPGAGIQQDRIFLTGSAAAIEALHAQINQLSSGASPAFIQGLFGGPSCREHPGFCSWGARENVDRFSLQVGGGTGGVFFDIDEFGPTSVAGVIGHFYEVGRNAGLFGGGKRLTDPLVIGRGLIGRGIALPYNPSCQ